MSKVYKLAEQEVDVTVGYKPHQASLASKLIKTFFLAAFCFSLIGAILVLLLDPFKPVVVPDPEPLLAEGPPPPILPPMPGYVQIQVIDFEDAAVSPAENVGDPAVTRNITPGIEALPTITRPQSTDVVENPAVTATPQVIINAPVTDPTAAIPPRPEEPPRRVVTPTLPPQYSIDVSDISPAEFDILDGVAFGFGKKAEITAEHAVPVTLWTVYTPRQGGGIVIEGVEVASLRTFNSRAVALQYAEKLVEDSFIRSEQLIDRKYEVYICCMELENAKSFAQLSNITDKLFRIKKEAK